MVMMVMAIKRCILICLPPQKNPNTTKVKWCHNSLLNFYRIYGCRLNIKFVIACTLTYYSFKIMIMCSIIIFYKPTRLNSSALCHPYRPSDKITRCFLSQQQKGLAKVAKISFEGCSIITDMGLQWLVEGLTENNNKNIMVSRYRQKKIRYCKS